MSTIRFDPQKLIGPVNSLVEVQLPRAATTALNRALFASQRRLKDVARQEFESPVPYTLSGFRVDKAEQKEGRIQGRVYINDDVQKGNSRSSYLDPHIRGGRAYPTRFQGALLRTIVTQITGSSGQVADRGEIYRPTRSFSVRPHPRKRGTSYPTMSPGQYTQILSALKGGKSSADFEEKGAVPFALNRQYTFIDRDSLNHPFFKNRFTYSPKPGIYKIERSRGQARFYRVMNKVPLRPYEAKFEFFDEAATTISDVFASELRKNILR